MDKMTTDRIKKGWISNSGIIKSVVGLFTLARTDFADIELFRDELAFRPGKSVPPCGRDQEALDNEARDADPVLYHRLESAPGSEISRSPPGCEGHAELRDFSKTSSTSLGNVRKFSNVIQ